LDRHELRGLSVRISDMNWMQVEAYLKHDDRAVLPLGSTEQHSYLRLTVDCILPERVAVEAAEPLGIPVFPVVAYGVTPYFREFPGSISLRVETHLSVVRDILDSMAHSGFRRILIVNGHGGNGAVQQFAQEWAADHTKCRVMFHNWWNAPQTWAKVQAIDPVASHGSWMENFPWTRLPASSAVAMPTSQRPMVDLTKVRLLDPVALRTYLGDGNYGGMYQRSDDEMLALWQVAVDETRALLTGNWGEA
jgi:creatinine amidohydrolase